MTDAAGTPPSRRPWLLVALTVSLALNLFLLGVIAGHMHRHAPPQFGLRERFEHIAGRLKLNDAQKASFQQFETTLRRNGPAIRAANVAAWTKIGDPATTPEQIGTLLQDSVKKRVPFQEDTAAALAKFLATLTQQQRAVFVDQARNPGRHRP